VTSGALLGRYSAGSGVVQELTLGSGLSLNTSTGVLSATATGSLTGTGAAGYVPYWSSSTALAYDNTAGGQFFWDATNHRLGIGLAAPTQALDVFGKITGNAFIVKPVTGAAIPANGAPTASNFTNMIVAFAATSCPANWTPYVAAYGRFLRGIDPTGATTVDPRGTVAPGTQQADAFQGHNHDMNRAFADNGNGNSNPFWASSGNTLNDASIGHATVLGPTNDGTHGSPRTASETRPVNVAVIFCQYTGTGMGGGASALSGLTDVDTTGIASGKVLAYNGTKWVPTTASGGSSSSGTAGYVQFSGGSGAFASDSTSGGQLFWDATNHRLGIGTAGPGYALDIQQSSNTTVQLMGTTSTVRGGMSVDTPVAAAFYSGSYSNAPYVFGTNNAERMRIAASGNVGIGTASPTFRLDVAGNARMGSQVEIPGATAGGWPLLGFNAFYDGNGSGGWTNTGTGYSAVVETMQDNGRMAFLTNGTSQTAGASFGLNERVSILQNGNVGIGTATPAYPLDVVGIVQATAYYHSSDERLKTNITPIDDPFALLRTIRGVHFIWRKDGKPSYGVIAQDVEKSMPEAVSEGTGGMKSVEYDQIIGPLVTAVKALDARNEALERRVRELEAHEGR
jgi:hypothetical protein